MDGSKCAACPTYAHCDGTTFKCGGKFTRVGKECLCPNGAFACKRKGDCHCYACPRHGGKCDGRGNWTCTDKQNPLRTWHYQYHHHGIKRVLEKSYPKCAAGPDFLSISGTYGAYVSDDKI